MRCPPFPFEMILVRAEEERDERQRQFLLKRNKLREQQSFVQGQRERIEHWLADVAAQREGGPIGAAEQSHASFLTFQSRQLGKLLDAEAALERELEAMRQSYLRAALKARVWKSLRERFIQSWQASLRKIEEAELEDWTRARLKPTRSRAVV